MDFDGISDFIALAACRSFSKAADIRHVTQPAFSRRIQALETSVGATLIDRSLSPVSLTRAGERFLLHARLVVETMSKAVEDAQSRISVIQEPLYVTAQHSLSYSFFPQWYRHLQKIIPDLRISLSTQRGSKCVQDVRAGMADMAIIMVSEEVPSCFNLEGLESLVVGSESLVAVQARFLKKGARDFLSYESGSHMNAMARRVLESNNVADFQISFESPATELLKAMVLAGFGIAVLPESIINDDIAQGFLKPAFEAAKTLPCHVLVVRKQASTHIQVNAVWDAMQLEDMLGSG